MLKAAVVVVGNVAVARFAVPRSLARVDASRSREVFLLAILAMCIGTAWLTAHAGLSLALGAFLGGMVVADTEYGHRALGDILPLRDAFVSIFFVSLMFFDARVVLATPLRVGPCCWASSRRRAPWPPSRRWRCASPRGPRGWRGWGLGQFGEFGFVLVKLGRVSGVIDEGAGAPARGRDPEHVHHPAAGAGPRRT
ncbi:MAG: cation:proton antiporter [Polyangiales bacterium]